MRNNLEQTRQLGERLYAVPDSELPVYLSNLRANTGALEITVFEGATRILATSSAYQADQFPLFPSEDMLLSLRRSGDYISLDTLPDAGYLIHTAVLLPNWSQGEDRILQGVFPVDKRISLLASSVERTTTRYAELSFLRGPLKSSFILTLSIVVLVSLLLAVYGAFFFARRLMAPVQSLVAGTRAVARGDFDTRLPEGRRDEIGFLVDSFNNMIAQLATERAAARHSEAQVENERASLEAILARLSTGVIALENDLSIRTANESAGAILNVKFKGQEGQSIIALSEHNDELKQFIEAFQVHIESGEKDWREKVELQTDSGRRVLVCTCTKMPGSYRSRSGLVIVLDDITELLQAQRDAAWGEVARRLAHEIKNPLTPIQLSAERIRRKYLSAGDHPPTDLLDRATQTIVQQVEAMRDMVNAFSEYARAPELNLAALDLNKLISQVADLYPAHNQQPKLRLDLDSSLPEVSLDAVRMRQVLHNLIRNALEALEGSDKPEVSISTRLDIADNGHWAEITIHDNGPGIPANKREQIFEPYVTSKDKGTGLGLAIVKKLVEEHGGEVRIDSDAGEGTCVRIRLPLQVAHKHSGGGGIRRKSA
jgi:nitrogen fixation/metabolism regulation signal transduction histidine kinase